MNPANGQPYAPCGKSRRIVSLAWVCALVCSIAQAASVQFNRDIRPILAENCLACHGPDPGTRKAGLQLDTRAGLFEGRGQRPPAVVPRDPAASDLWVRVDTSDPDDVMPPPKSNKTLTPEQKALLKQWIEEGAAWQDHWAFIIPERPAPPSPRQSAWVRNPIDAFVLARLEAEGLAPAAEADRRTLARRLSLDLTGLPPSPEQLDRFVRDRAPGAYERLVRAFLTSPHYGEHRARYWLDAARYADTHGLHFDNYREMWPYRDWVVRAFNRNQRFDQFVIEQLAGDLLPEPTDEQLVATGFQRCNPTTNEGGTIEEENLANYANDRVTTTGWVFLGLTANCASCHDHKFDPFTMKDFYSLAAFYRNTTQTGFDRNRREGDGGLIVPQTPEDAARWKALPAELEQARQRQQTQATLADNEFTNWLTQVDPTRPPRELLLGDEALRLPLTEGGGPEVTGRVEGRRLRVASPEGLEWRGGPLGPAPVLTEDRHLLLGDRGVLRSTEPFTLSAWVVVPDDFKGGGAILARMGGEEERHRGWDFFVRDDHFGIHMVRDWPSVAMKVRSQEKTIRPGHWHHLVAVYDGSTRAEGVRLYVDGLPVPTNHERDSLDGSIQTSLPLRLGRRERGDKLNQVAVQDARLYHRTLDPAEVAALATAPRLPELASRVEWTSTNNPARELLRGYFRVTQHRSWRQATRQLTSLEQEFQVIRGRSPFTQVQREKPNSTPSAHVLFRGQYDQPREQVEAATPAALHPWPADAPRNRLGLARWLVAPDNPLTARVTVNRFWQELFGTGLVKTTEDFGIMGERPSHPELLDWLAVEFQASGWNVHHLLTLMVTSATYRQNAAVTPEKLEKDRDNRLFSRGPRFRLDAEVIRDYALAASGLLVTRLGGPSVFPYQPEGVWEAVAMPESNTRYYSQDSGEALYRRSLYTFWKRAAPAPSLEILNAPSREVCTVRRERTNTPLQALATLNDPQYVEAARHLAETAWIRSRGRRASTLNFMAQRLLGRTLTDSEQRVLERTMDAATTYYQQQPDAAQSLLNLGESQPSGNVEPPALAALTVAANTMMNLDEVLNK